MLRPRYHFRGALGQPAGVAGVTTKTVDGVSYRLAPPGLLAEALTDPSLSGVTPTAAKVVTINGVNVPAADIAWATRAATAERGADYLHRKIADGDAVIASEMTTLLPDQILFDGVPASQMEVAGSLEGALITTRDLGLVGKLMQADPGMLVLQEPSGGWNKGLSKALLVGGGVVIVAGGILYFYTRRR